LWLVNALPSSQHLHVLPTLTDTQYFLKCCLLMLHDTDISNTIHPKDLKTLCNTLHTFTIWREHCGKKSAKKCGKSHLWHFPFLGVEWLLQTQENVTGFLILLIKVEYALDVARFLQAVVWSLEHYLYSFKHIAIIYWSSRIGEIKGFCDIKTHNVVTIIISNFVTSIWSNTTHFWNVW